MISYKNRCALISYSRFTARLLSGIKNDGQQQQSRLMAVIAGSGVYSANGNCNYARPHDKRKLCEPPSKQLSASLSISRKMSAGNGQQNKKLVRVEEARRFMKDCLCAAGTPEDHAAAMADLLVAADYRGHQSHGMNRLEMYINDLTTKCTDGSAVPKILKETPATAWVDGCNGLGAVVGNFCMDLAIKKAKTVGVGWVCAKGCNHYGIAGWYTLRAIKEGLVGMSTTNTSPFMVPTRGHDVALGTNPLSFGAPGKDGDKFVLDMATTAVAVGKIELQRRKGEKLPHGWAQGPDGQSTDDAELGFNTAHLFPLGGEEINSGYKGYGLGAMVDIMSGVMAGANYSKNIRKWSLAGSDKPANLGQVFIAVNPNCFAPGFEDRLSDLNCMLRTTKPVDPAKPVLVAGDKEELCMKAIDAAGGIQYVENQLKNCEALAARLNVQPLSFV